ncbi:MAG TPA: hypothetical protein VEW28_07615 [Candidatus Kapabacteria bacterium]|nr:hypothetical protein [Candidatus Kapabacteria bacterium]
MSRLWIFLLVAGALTFNGCIDFYLDIIAQPNGSFTVKRTLALSNDFIDMMKSFGKLGKDSNDISRQAVLDTMMHQMDTESVDIKNLAGVQSYNLRDSLTDSAGYVIAEANIRDLSSLANVTNQLMQTDHSKNDQSKPDKSDLKLTVIKTATSSNLTFSVTVDSKTSKEDKEFAEKMFGGHAFHLRVISPDLDRTKKKNLSATPNGLEWIVPLLQLSGVEPMKTKSVTFVLKNSK